MTPPPPPPPAGRAWPAVVAVLLVAVGLRLAHLPAAGEVRDCDELGYLSCGLQLWEGITPSYKTGPTGPQAWVQWGYAAAASGLQFVAGEPHVRAAPWQTRVFLAVDAALFRAYEDLGTLRAIALLTNVAVAAGGVYAAYRLGRSTGGSLGGVLVSGLVAVWPLGVDYAAQTRPYSDGWMFAVMAVASAAHPRPRRADWTGVWMGLAVASRLDMAGLAPLVAWWFWYRPGERPLGRQAGRVAGVTTAVVLLAAPWVLTSLVGNARLWATHVLIGQFQTAGGHRQNLIELVWGQGLGPYLAVAAAGLVLGGGGGRRERAARWVLAGLAGWQLWSMFSGPSQPFRFHGSRVLVLLVAGAVFVPAVLARLPRLAPALVGLLLAVPAFHAVALVAAGRAERTTDDLPDWLDRTVPPGTLVYSNPSWEVRCPLPTPDAARRAWEEVYDYRSWQRKYDRGLSRFGLPDAGYVPRGLAQENLVLDRLTACRVFILGGHPAPGRPRFDLRLYGLGAVFYTPEPDLPAAFRRTGGVVVWRGDPLPEGVFGRPVYARPGPAGRGAFVYCSADLRPALEAAP